MAENQTSTTKSSTTIIKYEGWNEKVSSDVLVKKKMDLAKQNLLKSINKNIDFYINNKDNAKKLSPITRILKDVEDYTTIMLRCGAKCIWRNTVKKSDYKHIDILYDLKSKVEADFFEKELKTYASNQKSTKKGKGKNSGSSRSRRRSSTANTSANTNSNKPLTEEASAE